MRISPSLLTQAQQIIPQLLAEASGRDVMPQVQQVGNLLEVRCEVLPSPLIVAAATESKRPVIRQAAERARAHAGGLPTIVVPHMTPAGAETARDEQVAWLDLAGNARLVAPGILLHVEGRPPLPGRRGRPSSAFAPRSARVARALLVEPGRRWSQKELIDATGLSQGTVSRTLSRLHDLGLVARDERRRQYWPPAPGELLDAWRDEYDYERHEILPVHLTASGLGLAREVAGGLKASGVEHAFTGLPAAWVYDGFAQFRIVSVFVDGSPLDAAERLGARIEEGGANVHLIRPLDDGVFYGAQEVDGLRCVHPLQVYLDLCGLPERAPEAAQHLREHRFSFR